jgi:hypothetical protein
LQQADHPLKESYKLSIKFLVTELILNGNRPEGLIHQGGRRKVSYYTAVVKKYFFVLEKLFTRIPIPYHKALPHNTFNTVKLSQAV